MRRICPTICSKLLLVPCRALPSLHLLAHCVTRSSSEGRKKEAARKTLALGRENAQFQASPHTAELRRSTKPKVDPPQPQRLQEKFRNAPRQPVGCRLCRRAAKQEKSSLGCQTAMRKTCSNGKQIIFSVASLLSLELLNICSCRHLCDSSKKCATARL